MAARIQAVTFDAAGTLFVVREPVGTTYARIAGAHGIHVDPAAVQAGFRAAFAAAPPLAFGPLPPAALLAAERDWWRGVVRRALGPAAAVPAFEVCFTALWGHYADGAAWRVCPEVPGVLAALRARGLRLTIVSNFDGRLPRLVMDLGLGPLLDGVVHSTAAGVAKPHPDVFLATVAALGAPPGATVHVGDEPATDVAGARAAGLRAVLVDRAGHRPPVPADVPVIDDLRALPALLDHAQT